MINDDDFRFQLTRTGLGGTGALNWLLVNPSIAESDPNGKDDPTIRRVIGFTKGFGYDQFTLFNLIPRRGTDPKSLIPFSKKKDFESLFGVESEKQFKLGDIQFDYLHCISKQSNPLICAWGATVDTIPWAFTIALEYLWETLRDRKDVYTLGDVTSSGHPKHPLYLASDTPMKPFDLARYIEERI